MTDIIVSYAVTQDSPQADGRRWITEAFTDCVGIVQTVQFLAPQDFDTAADLPLRAAAVGAALTSGEIAANLGQVLANGAAAVLTFNYSTEAQSVGAMAAQAGSLTPWQVVLLGQFLASLDETYLTGAIGLSAAQITALQSAAAGVASALAELGSVIAAIAAQGG